MGELAAAFLKQHRHVGHGFFGLGGDVAHAYRFPGIQILADLAAQEYRVAGDHGLAQVVVQPLFGIGFARIEFADAGVGHVWVLMGGGRAVARPGVNGEESWKGSGGPAGWRRRGRSGRWGCPR
ncbi:hypothetical protein D9M68_784060 [compost metagenome]